LCRHLTKAQNFPILIQGLRKVFDTQPYDYEFIFVDDGSKDETADVLKTLNIPG
jgi:glycosyltransferase involved in cell wall biosynthesis